MYPKTQRPPPQSLLSRLLPCVASLGLQKAWEDLGVSRGSIGVPLTVRSGGHPQVQGSGWGEMVDISKKNVLATENRVG